MSDSKCCITGFNWDGKPVGKEEKLAGNNAYVVGDNKDAAILLIHDVFGWTFPNLRLLADHFAKEANATCYLVDFFDGEVIEPDTLTNEEKRKNFDLMAFIGRHSKETRFPEMTAAAKELKSKHKKVGAIGYCYGGWACLQLGAKGQSLVDCISIAHPSLTTKEEYDNVAVPIQILAPENDFAFTPELKEHSLKVLPTLGVEFDYQYFPGVAHGFAAKGDANDDVQRKALERAKNAASMWFSQHLHF